MNRITISSTALDQQPDSTGYRVQSRTSLKTLAGKYRSIAELEAFIEQIMEQADVAGLSCAILNEAQIAYQKAFGYRNKNDSSRNDEQTSFLPPLSAKPFSPTWCWCWLRKKSLTWTRRLKNIYRNRSTNILPTPT